MATYLICLYFTEMPNFSEKYNIAGGALRISLLFNLIFF